MIPPSLPSAAPAAARSTSAPDDSGHDMREAGPDASGLVQFALTPAPGRAANLAQWHASTDIGSALRAPEATVHTTAASVAVVPAATAEARTPLPAFDTPQPEAATVHAAAGAAAGPRRAWTESAMTAQAATPHAQTATGTTVRPHADGAFAPDVRSEELSLTRPVVTSAQTISAPPQPGNAANSHPAPIMLAAHDVPPNMSAMDSRPPLAPPHGVDLPQRPLRSSILHGAPPAREDQVPPGARTVADPAVPPPAPSDGPGTPPPKEIPMDFQGAADDGASAPRDIDPIRSEQGRTEPVRVDATRADTARSVGTQLVEAVRVGANGSTDVALNPEELGRVRLSLTAQDGALHVSVTAERPETQDLLRRHIGMLQADFRALGYTDVAFDFGPGQDHAGQSAKPAQDTAQRDTPTGIDATDPSFVADTPRSATVSSRLDLRL